MGDDEGCFSGNFASDKFKNVRTGRAAFAALKKDKANKKAEEEAAKAAAEEAVKAEAPAEENTEKEDAE